MRYYSYIVVEIEAPSLDDAQLVAEAAKYAVEEEMHARERDGADGTIDSVALAILDEVGA